MLETIKHEKIAEITLYTAAYLLFASTGTNSLMSSGCGWTTDTKIFLELQATNRKVWSSTLNFNITQPLVKYRTRLRANHSISK